MPYKDRNQRNAHEQKRRKVKRDEARRVKLTVPREGAREEVIHRMVKSAISTIKYMAYHNIKNVPKMRRKDYRRNRYQNDPEYRLRCKLSVRLREAFLSQTSGDGAVRKDCEKESTATLIGCSFGELRAHLESTSNGRKFVAAHIDHIFPLRVYNLQTESAKAMHWSNLQLLEGKANQSKNGGLPSRQLAQRVHRDRWPEGVTEADLC
jgi:5-methylcytosine-specific restriction endonuclease McrA